MVDPAVPRRPHQELHPRGALLQEQVIHVGFAVTDAHQVGLRTAGVRLAHGLHTGQPPLAFFVGHRPVFAGGTLPDGGRVASPHLLCQQAQRQALWRQRQRRMDVQPLMRGSRERAQAGGGGMGGPIHLGGILHRQHPWDGRQPVAGGDNMAPQDRLGGDGLMVKKAIRRFQHRPVPTGLWQRGAGTVGEDGGQFH